MKCATIVAAGGYGSRFSAGTPKQLIPLGGRPLFVWCLRVFEQVKAVREIVVVVPPGLHAEFCEAARGIARLKWAAGGARRQDSVRAGLEAVSEDVEIVLVHDAARPFISLSMVEHLVEAAAHYGAAIPVAPVVETLKEVVAERVVATVDRSRIFCAQTPQAFRRELLASLFDAAPQDQVWTDESSMAEFLGVAVAAVPGERRNIKITYPEDLRYAEYLAAEIGAPIAERAPGREAPPV